MKTATEYLVARYEDNGYHDSYFYATVWNPITKTIRDIMEGATAFAGGCSVDAPPLKDAPAKIKAAFMKWACHRAAEMVVAADLKYVMEPDKVVSGDKLMLLRDVRPKKTPLIPKGATGEVFWSGAFGTFYSNGYNKPGRSNTRVGLILENGDRVYVALSSCRRNLEIKDLKAVEKGIRSNFKKGDFSIIPLTGCKAWLSASYL
jgi:hypothetical protein